MFGWFKSDKKQTRQLLDLEGNTLLVGDKVFALRYELGECVIIEKDEIIFYRSESNGQEISFTKMIDAITGHQKVKKLGI